LLHNIASIILLLIKELLIAVGFNSPYSGTMVPLRYYRKDKRVQSIMIELNRSLYLEKGTSNRNADFTKILKTLFDLEMLLTVGNWEE